MDPEPPLGFWRQTMDRATGCRLQWAADALGLQTQTRPLEAAHTRDITMALAAVQPTDVNLARGGSTDYGHKHRPQPQ